MTKALILDGSSATDLTGKRVAVAVKNSLQSHGYEVEHQVLRDKKIVSCAGDFFCWIRTPGMCMVDDDHRAIAMAVMRCDLLVFLTPVTFGGYSSTLKRAVDRLTQNNLPFFTKTDGEIHHQPRYSRHPKLLAIGWSDGAQEDEKAIFHTLVRRNGINLHFPCAVSGIVQAEQTDEVLASAVCNWVIQVQNGALATSQGLLQQKAGQLSQGPTRNALLLVGSPRGSKSTSQALGGYLFEQLSAHSLPVKTIYLYQALKSPEGIQSLLEAVAAHDLIMLASPLYIDGLPGPVIYAFEQIVACCARKPEKHAFSALINSGFPEAKQSETALAMCAAFAFRAGFTWVGGLTLGGGAGVVNGTPLPDLGWRARSIRKAFELTASRLSAGNPVPGEAIKLMGKNAHSELASFCSQ